MIKMEKVFKKALMKTPINGARLSSPFGMRKHPIDTLIRCIVVLTAAPMGTPIMASENGIIKSRMVWWWRKLCSN